MAMNGTGLATALKNAINAIPQDSRTFDAVWNAIGNALVSYISANAVVSSFGTATAVSPGGGTAPVTASGSIA